MPYDPASTSSPIEVQDRDDRDRAESYIRERGPLHLLEAVYCDPCKAKVINSASKLKREEGFLYLIQWKARELENKFDIFGAY